MSRWLAERPAWLAADESPADPLADLKTYSNRLSVFHFEEPLQGRQVVAALAAHCENVSSVDYAVFDETVLVNTGIEATTSSGDTPDAEVNQWHRDLIELSAEKIARLTAAILATAEFERVQRKRLLRWIADAIRSGRLSREHIKLKGSALAKVNQMVGPGN